MPLVPVQAHSAHRRGPVSLTRHARARLWPGSGPARYVGACEWTEEVTAGLTCPTRVDVQVDVDVVRICSCAKKILKKKKGKKGKEKRKKGRPQE